MYRDNYSITFGTTNVVVHNDITFGAGIGDRHIFTKQNRTLQNNERKFDQYIDEEGTRTNSQADTNETKQFWCTIWKRKEYKGNTEWINNIKSN